MKQKLIKTLKDTNKLYLTMAEACFKIATNEDLNEDGKQRNITALTSEFVKQVNQSIKDLQDQTAEQLSRLAHDKQETESRNLRNPEYQKSLSETISLLPYYMNAGNYDAAGQLLSPFGDSSVSMSVLDNYLKANGFTTAVLPKSIWDMKIDTLKTAVMLTTERLTELKEDSKNVYSRLCKQNFAPSEKDAFSYNGSWSCTAMAEYLEGLNEDATDFTAPKESMNVSLARMQSMGALEEIKGDSATTEA